MNEQYKKEQKERKERYDKMMQAKEAAKKVIKSEENN